MSSEDQLQVLVRRRECGERLLSARLRHLKGWQASVWSPIIITKGRTPRPALCLSCPAEVSDQAVRAQESARE